MIIHNHNDMCKVFDQHTLIDLTNYLNNENISITFDECGFILNDKSFTYPISKNLLDEIVINTYI